MRERSFVVLAQQAIASVDGAIALLEAADLDASWERHQSIEELKCAKEDLDRVIRRHTSRT